MKNYKLLLLVVFLFFTSGVLRSQEKTDFQKRIRASIQTFLTEEGFNPTIDSDGDLAFKKEGESYYVAIGTNESPIYINFIKAGIMLTENDDRGKCLYACNEINRKFKTIKVMLFENSLGFRVEMFLRDAEEFRYVFYRCIEVLDEAENVLYEVYKESPSCIGSENGGGIVSNKVPFIITDTQVANVYKNGTIETDYGGKIYDINTLYLKPKITITPFKTGTYTVYIKLYTPTGLSTGTNSPDGFSTQTSITINSLESISYILNGWGEETKGNWKMGNYRYEFWIGDICVGSKSFSIY